jgi:CheY-like chemotaxis protein
MDIAPENDTSRERLEALATLATVSLAPRDRQALVKQTALQLGAMACAIHGALQQAGAEICLLHCEEGVDPAGVEELFTMLQPQVVLAEEAIRVSNLGERYRSQLWLRTCGLQNYLGIPLFDGAGSISAIAAVFGNKDQTFASEDEWFLKIAGRLVADSLARDASYARTQAEPPQVREGQPVNESRRKRASAAGRRPTILVIDDNRQVNDVLCGFLSMRGYAVEPAFNGLEGLELFEPSRHDLVITDVAMPLMNGWELIAALKPKWPDCPVILISGYGAEAWNRTKAGKEGVSAVLQKPLDLDELANTVKNLLAC